VIAPGRDGSSSLVPASPDDGIDRPTLVAIAVVAFALANLVHEGVGHGGACLLAGGRARALSAIHFDGDLGGLAPAAGKWVAAGGTLANLTLGLLAAAALRFSPGHPARPASFCGCR